MIFASGGQRIMLQKPLSAHCLQFITDLSIIDTLPSRPHPPPPVPTSPLLSNKDTVILWEEAFGEWVRFCVRKYQETIIRPQSPQLAESLWTDPDIKKVELVCKELISTSKKKKKEKSQAGNEWPITFSQNPRKRGKSHQATTTSYQKLVLKEIS